MRATMFQHTAARRRLPGFRAAATAADTFQHTAARRRLPGLRRPFFLACEFQHTAARRRLPKLTAQPLESLLFQHTAARRRLPRCIDACPVTLLVSTHSRPKAAAETEPPRRAMPTVSTHSRPKAAAFDLPPVPGATLVSTHSRPKAAAPELNQHSHSNCRFNTQPPEGGCAVLVAMIAFWSLFQHTAARRRLLPIHIRRRIATGFNTQPPEGGCLSDAAAAFGIRIVSTHSRPKAAAPTIPAPASHK